MFEKSGANLLVCVELRPEVPLGVLQTVVQRALHAMAIRDGHARQQNLS